MSVAGFWPFFALSDRINGGMTMIPVSSFAFHEVAAAAAKNELRNVEEELLTPYSDKDLTDGWEFKILRSPSGVFNEPDRMREILEEEAQAGWILVEKFDRHRLRLKRSSKAGKDDRHLSFDAWRTTIGASQSVREVKIALIVTFVLVAVVLAVGIGIMIFGPPG